ncbi:MAG: carboxylating nicotinate-nucleotide diphosphorylase [Fimbriimonadales bacterium]|nr:carboxylating nicotinate-nucleotide diphosphorylase [Fimbriimonadales bacterium]
MREERQQNWGISPALSANPCPWMSFAEAHAVNSLIERALQEDLGAGDWTTDSLIPPNHTTRCAILAQADGIVCGVLIAQRVFQALDPTVRFLEALADGACVAPDTTVLGIEGDTRAILKAERTALNFLQHLSGVATLTRQFVDAVAGTGAQIVDTRKTTPGLRLLEKYAVRVGGGRNHRIGLYDGILIKDNHLAALGGDIREAVRRARQNAPHLLAIEVECATLEQVQHAIDAGADGILLDNMPLETLRAAVQMAKGRVRFIEASGGVNLQTVRAIAETGVDFISVGTLTHSAPILPMHLEF